ncbi:spinster family MFS transporter [Indioceanicola profundi]|uniref:spinster family MFS transporter n=1 Tax=Indioceanicola profundi TaxID=2220096 RepID=UPI000E6AD5B6|nr:MFS transporter [Indioceanicola profundi]
MTSTQAAADGATPHTVFTKADIRPFTAEPVSKPYRIYAAWLLLGLYTLNFLDRQVVNILAEPIKRDLGLADWQLGMLTGLSFALFYSVLGIPIARLAERKNRVRIISVSVAVWSLFTVACGYAASFAQLLAARIGVGVGEAGLTPPAHSLITDYTPKEKRASALAFYSLGIPLGTLAGMALGGLIADEFGWRTAFLVAGLPGLLLAIIAWATLREPRTQARASAPVETPDLRDAFTELRGKKAFWRIAIGASLVSFVAYGHVAFLGSFYFRNHGQGLTELAAMVDAATGLSMGAAGFLGTALGLMIGIFGAAGTYLGGHLADRAARTDVAGYLSIPAYGAFIGVPFFLKAMLVDSTLLSILVLGIPVMMNSLWYGPIYAAVQGLVRPRSRATAVAVLLFLVNMIGLGLGPLSVGLVSDAFAGSMGAADGLRWALIVTGGVAVLSAALFFSARPHLRAEMTS